MTKVDLIQSIAIVSSLLIAWYQIRRQNVLQRPDAAWRIAESHRDVWKPLVEEDSLSRILCPEVDLHTNPISIAERRVIVNVIVHMSLVFTTARSGSHTIGRFSDKDIGKFLSLPLPFQVWSEVKEYYDRSFVSFVENAAKQFNTGDQRKDSNMKLKRRLAKTKYCLDDPTCPAVWETDSGDVVVIGANVTDDVKLLLPQGEAVAPDENAVKISRSMLNAAVESLREEP